MTDPHIFKSVRTTVEILKITRELAPKEFAWRQPPYEYEEKLLPVDILWGSSDLRNGIDKGKSADNILAPVRDELLKFTSQVEPYLLYD